MYSKYEILPSRGIVYGINALSELPNLIDEMGCRRVGVVTVEPLLNSEILKKIKNILKDRICVIFGESMEHTPAESVFKAREAIAENKADIIISLGGGTVTDTGKATRFLISRRINKIEQLESFVTRKDSQANKNISSYQTPLPQIAIPTTLSGSEFTDSVPITDAHLVKRLYVYRDMIPTFVILDPEATFETPDRLWLSTGIKAIDHAVEQIYAKEPQEITTALSYRALELLFKNLPESYLHPSDIEVRKSCQTGAFMAIFGIMNISLGLSHVIGHQIGPKWAIGHGITSCLSMPAVLEFNLPYSLDAQAKMAAVVGLGADKTKEQAALEFARQLKLLIKNLNLPSGIHEVRKNRDDFPQIAEHILEDPLLKANPRPISYEDIITVLNNAW